MSKLIDLIVQTHGSLVPPNKTNVLWDDGTFLRIYRNNKWEIIGGAGGLSSGVHIAYANSADGVKDFTIEYNDDIDYAYLGISTEIEKPIEPEGYNWLRLRGLDGEKGEKGPQGPVGPRGPQGIQGVQGPAGDVAIGSFSAMAFRSYPTKPPRPEGGAWNSVTNTISYPLYWGPSDNLEKPVWMSQKVFYTDPSLERNWSDPILISGTDGTNGSDGDAIEFMYKVTKNYSSKPTIPDPDEQYNWDPKASNWTDDPSGIDEFNQCEWVITRMKENNAWGPWEGPKLWAKWGDSGIDGAGVEYIYWRDPNNSGVKPDNPTPQDWKTNAVYQKVDGEYVPEKYGWTDNPSGVNENQQYEWVCVRRFRKYTDPDTGITTDNKIWCEFEGPALWAHYGEDGVPGVSGYRVKTLYYISESTTEIPPYDKNNANPGSGWDFFPTNYNKDMIIWAIDAYIDIDGKLVSEWSNCRLITGIKGTVDIPSYYNSTYFTTTDDGGIPAKPAANRFSTSDQITSKTSKDNTVTWIDLPTDPNKQWYQCVGVINSSTSIITNWGEVSIWNGKNGEDGDALESSHWEIRVAIWDKDDLDGPPINKTDINPNTGLDTAVWKEITATTDLVLTPGQRLWETKAKFTPQGAFANGGWCTPYPISGETGPKGDTGPAGPAGANGTAGVAGISYIERYSLGTLDGPKAYWTNDFKTDKNGVVNHGWTTTIPKVNSEYPYIWCIKSRYNDSINYFEGWEGPFRITGTNGINGTSATPTTIGVLTNPTDLVVCDAAGNVLVGLPISTTLKVYNGVKEEKILPSTFKYEVLDDNPNDGVSPSDLIVIESDINTATITVTNILPTAPKSINIKLSGKVSGSSVEYSQILSLKLVYSNELPVQANLLNDSTIIPAKNNALLDKDVVNTFNMYVGASVVELSKLYLSTNRGDSKTYAGVIFEPTKNASGNYTGEFKLTLDDAEDNSAFTTDVLIIYITGECTHEGTTYSRTLPIRLVRINGGDNAEWYELNISTPVIVYKPDKNEFLPKTITVNVDHHYGSEIETLSIEDIAEHGLVVAVKEDDESNTKTITSSTVNLTEFEDLEERLIFTLKNKYTLNELDIETVPVVSDGLGAITYSLVPSVDVIQYNEEGRIVNIEHEIIEGSEPPTETCYVSCGVIMHLPNNGGIVKLDENTIKDYSDLIDIRVAKDGVYSKYVPDDPIDAYSVKESIFFEIYNVSAEPDYAIDYKSIIVLKAKAGRKGQLVYPAGIYNVDKEYECTYATAPYVLDGEKYYVLNAIGVWKGSEQPEAYNRPSTNYNNGENPDAIWIPFEMFEAIYSDIGVFNQALVGSAVFYKQYVFSQQGKDHNGNYSDHYEDFGIHKDGIIDFIAEPEKLGEVKLLDRDDLKFYPNICLDLLTGEGWLAGRNIKWNSDGEITFGSSVTQLSKLGPDGLYTGTVEAEQIKGKTITGLTIQSALENPSWVIGKNGAGWLANKNIAWDEDGNLYIKGNAYIGGSVDDENPEITNFAWYIDEDGNIVAQNNTAMFKKGGSGFIGKSSSSDSTDNAISWDNNGVVKIGRSLKYNFKEVYVEESTSENIAPSYTVSFSDTNKYIIRDPETSTFAGITPNDAKYYNMYIDWWGNKMKEGEIIDVDILNASSYTLSFYAPQFVLPIQKSIISSHPIFNYEETINEFPNNTISEVLVLPTTTIQLQICKRGGVASTYIKNIADFKYSGSYSKLANKISTFPSLISITPDMNSIVTQVKIPSVNKEDTETVQYDITNYCLSISEVSYSVGSNIKEVGVKDLCGTDLSRSGDVRYKRDNINLYVKDTWMNEIAPSYGLNEKLYLRKSDLDAAPSTSSIEIYLLVPSLGVKVLLSRFATHDDYSKENIPISISPSEERVVLDMMFNAPNKKLDCVLSLELIA